MQLDGRASGQPGRETMFAAGYTLVAAVGADVVAGNHAAHVATVGTAAVVVGLLRMASTGRRRAHVAVLSGVVVSQPALHAAANLIPSSAGHPLTDWLVGALQLLLAVLTVAGSVGGERLYRLVSGLWRVATRPSLDLAPTTLDLAQVMNDTRRARGGTGTGPISRRGPPAGPGMRHRHRSAEPRSV